VFENLSVFENMALSYFRKKENKSFFAGMFLSTSRCAEKQKGAEKRTFLEKAAQYYKKMKTIPKASRENLDKIEAFLKKSSSS